MLGIYLASYDRSYRLRRVCYRIRLSPPILTFAEIICPLRFFGTRECNIGFIFDDLIYAIKFDSAAGDTIRLANNEAMKAQIQQIQQSSKP